MIGSTDPASHCTNFWEVLRWRAERHSDRALYTFLHDGEAESETYTYGDLDRLAKKVAGWLTSRGAHGERVLLIYHQGLDFLAAFFGCLYAGAVAVPAYPPRANRKATRISGIVADADARFALTTTELQRQLEPVIAQDRCLAVIQWQAIDEISAACADDWRDPVITPQSTAFLQYTSGSTGDPKGVVVTHGNLLHNQVLIRQSFRQQESSTAMAGWLPLHHDMGLIGNALHPLYMGGQFVFMSPVDFVRRPIRWLKMISNHRATISGAPNSAYEMCVRDTTAEEREGLDLESWNCAYNGAEPVRKATIESFCQQFEPYGFRREAFCPCYGMAETTLLLAGSVSGDEVVDTCFDTEQLKQGKAVPVSRQAELAESLVACGIPDTSMHARIVDPESHRQCQPGTIGEIWARGPSVASGYWNKPEVNHEMFAATLSDSPDNGPYFRTGDLGFVHEDQLYITGRIKDLIIVGGANHYPHDIEATVEASHESLALHGGAAFAIESENGEQVVVIQELKRAHVRSADFDGVFTAILQAVSAEHQLPLRAIVLVRPGAVPKTTSGKIRRQEAARQFHEGEFKTVAVWDSQDAALSTLTAVPIASDKANKTLVESPCGLTTDQLEKVRELEDWLCQRLVDQLKLPPEKFDRAQPLARYGIGSLTAVRLADELSRHLGRTIPVTVAFDHPHIPALAHFLVTGSSLRNSIGQPCVSSDEPLAVVGIGCRFPAANSPSEFWSLLRRGGEGIGFLRQRYQQLSLERNQATEHQSTRAGLLERIDQFDPRFFMIGPKEADEIDPQQRLLLEVSWEAFEDAGIPLDGIAGSRTGVFVGVSAGDYLTLQTALGYDASAYLATGNSLAIAANRISYTFDLCGPSLAVDTACSSSLVAVHQACESLRAGACDLAIAGGVNLILNPGTTSCFDQAGMLSAAGACQTFSAAADGFVRGEGCGAILLKRLSQAEANGDRIYCVIRGSAVNQDGKSIGLTAPNGVAQQNVIRTALADARVEADEVDYVEAHGTGTPLGDPIEMGALAEVFATNSQRPCPLQVGSVKTNIGHLEAAAGIAGLIKVCLGLDQQAIPAHLHFNEPSPHIDWNLPLKVPTELVPWPRTDRTRIAGVSSFGFGGTNAHVVLAEAPLRAQPQPATPQQQQLLTISAKSNAALKTLASRYADALQHLDDHDSLDDFCYTANARRQHFRHRLAVRTTSATEVAKQLALWATSDEPGSLAIDEARRQFSVCWMFSGQGGIFPGAGRQLYEREPAFRDALDQCGELLRHHWPTPLRTILWEDDRLWRMVDIQPAVFCLQHALSRMWEAWGIQPSAVLGHSLGEYAAACVAGVFSLEDALKLVCLRADLVASLPEPGAMLAVLACDDQVQECMPAGTSIDIAAINGPRQTVVAGGQAALQDFRELLKRRGLRALWLKTTHAFHSPLIEPILDRFSDAAEEIRYSRPRTAYLSSVTGDWVDQEVANAEYWRRNLRQTVRFYPATRRLAEGTVCLELGAGATLTTLLNVSQSDSALVVLPGLTADDDEWVGILANLSQLYVAGASPNWTTIADATRRVVSLPAYPMERSRHWFDRHMLGGDTTIANVSQRHDHPLLGNKLDLATDEIVFAVDTASQDYLADHRLESSIVFPTAGYLEIALAAGEILLGKPVEVRDLTISNPLKWSDDETPTVQVVATPTESGLRCRVLSRSDSGWHPHAQWELNSATEQTPQWAIDGPIGTEVGVEQHFSRCGRVGLDYGPAFRGIQRLFVADQKAWGEVAATTERIDPQYLFHPTTLDACLQIVAGMFPETIEQAWLPAAVGSYRLYRTVGPDEKLTALAEVVPTKDAGAFAVDIKIASQRGDAIAQLDGVILRPAGGMDVARMAYQEEWVPKIRGVERAPILPRITPTGLTPHLISCRDEIAEDVGLPNHMRALEELETLSTTWVAHTLRAMGADLRLGELVSPSDLAEKLGIAEQHHRLLGRFCQMLEETGTLDQPAQNTESRWQVRQLLPHLCPLEFGAELLQRHPQAKYEVGLVQRCGKGLPAVLRGECEPLSLLFPDDDSVSAAEVYRASPGGQAVNRLVAATVDRAQQDLSRGRGLRILEIGAGTGATTEAILSQVDLQRTQVTFSDVSPTFLLRAKSRFAHYSCVDYRLFDVERSPESQGFNPSGYDLIVAANVLHATADLSASLANIRQLLAPGGLLIVVEGTRPVGWLDLTFGLTPGWWRFSDTDRRPDYPLLSRTGWMTLLEEEGFSDTAIIQPIEMSERHRDPENSVIVSKFDESASTIVHRDDSLGDRSQQNRWLILGGPEELAKRLAQRLTDEGDDCRCVTTAQMTENESTASTGFADRRAAIEMLIGPDHPDNIVFLAPVDTPTRSESLPDQVQDLNEALLAVAQAMVQESDRRGEQTPRLWIVTRGTQTAPALSQSPVPTHLAQATMWGWVRTLNLERPNWPCRAIDLDPAIPFAEVPGLLADELCADRLDDEREIAFRGDLRLVRRLVPAGRSSHVRQGDQPRRWEISRRGSIEGLQLVPHPQRPPGLGEITVEVRACGINFRDVLNTLGLYPGDAPLGAECAGVVTAVGAGVEQFSCGHRVAVVAADSLCEELTVPAASACRIPSELTFVEAVTIPVAFLTARAALEEIGQIRRGAKILIHAATGGVGLACLQLAQHAGAEVFATASAGKHETLRQLGIGHIYDSRKPGYGEQILGDTNGQGVDVVVNSLAEEFLEENLHCLTRGGVYVEIARPQPGVAERVARLRNDLRYAQLDLAQSLQADATLIQTQLADLMDRARRGQIEPLPAKCFALEDARDAFRTMRSASHVGKLVLTRSAETESSNAATRRAASDQPIFRTDATYLIAGGLGGLGLFVTRWMSLNGAAQIALLARSEPNSDQQETIAQIESQSGCRITHCQADLSNSEEVHQSLARLRRDNPIAGVFHFAGVLDNGLIENQSPAHLERVFAPKVRGAWNLHQATAEDPLEHFVLFSSAAAALGSPGQVNHAAANAFLDALASYRQTQGRPALSINWGPWSRIGSAQDIKQRGILSGIGMIEPAFGLAFLQDQLQRNVTLPQIIAMELDCSKLPDHVCDLPMFEQLLKLSRKGVDFTVRSSEFRQRYEAAPEAARRPMLLAHLRSLVAAALGMNDPTAVRADEALFDLGLDSLTSLEVRNQVQTSFQIDVPSTILFDYPTPNALADQLGKLMLPAIEKVESRTGMPWKDAEGSHPLPNQDLTNVTEGVSDAGESETGRNGTRIELNKLMESIHELSDDLAGWADDGKEVS